MNEHADSAPMSRSARVARWVFVGSCFGAALALLFVVGGAIAREVQRSTTTDFILRGQAAQFASAGLSEAINWLRRQPEQPVTGFAPEEADSLRPAVGLLREFPINREFTGRFEVHRSDGPEPFLRARDVSAERGFAQPGAVWRLRCKAVVFRTGQPDEVAFTEVYEVEATRFGVRLPGKAALCAADGGKVWIGPRVHVRGGLHAAGIYHGGAGPRIEGGEIEGAGLVVPASGDTAFDVTWKSVFGVDRELLVAMADERSDEPNWFPMPMRPDSIYWSDADQLAFSTVRPLRGSGILIATGDLTLGQGSESTFTGLIYVAGNLTVHAPAELRGAVIARGEVRIQGSADWVTLSYDDRIVRDLADTVGAYRISRDVRLVREPAD